MKKASYTFRTLLCLLLAGFTFVSCSKDDDEDTTPSLNNQIEYNGTTYNIQTGIIEDWGSVGLSDGDEDLYISNDNVTHYNYDVSITDGTLQANSDGELENVGATVFVYAELLSPGTTNFTTGTFSYIEYEDDLTQEQIDAKYNNKSFFEDAYIVIDANGNGTLDASDASSIAYATGGTITVSGSNNNYTVDYNLTLDNGRTIVGSYSGDFQYFDQQ
ncbi:hypothetical protein [Pontibacter harenae]|uniref:hypothetical protein n=1 Tax=Pontibacter harenae TaxID=2894083 RepID=UPI001E5E009A|nr:hypothetical protein [Pontibacter harenae]MCC9166928.1 hypothetical protein [Pontibacter harenae]